MKNILANFEDGGELSAKGHHEHKYNDNEQIGHYIVIIFTVVEHYLPLCIGCNFGGNFLAFNGKMTKAPG